MNRFLLSVTIFTFLFSVMPSNILASDVDKNKPKKAIKVAPPSPKFTVKQRHNELAMRRKKVAEFMADNSMLIMMSADSRIYSNDVNFYYRQENNLYYLTALKQSGATLVITKNGDDVKETLFLPKRNPQAETWNGRMYSNENATELSGLTTITDARYTNEFLEAVKAKQTFASKDGNFSMANAPSIVYLVQGNRKEYAKENKMAKDLNASYDVRNASAFFAKLRLIKSPYEIKIMQHSVDITNEALMRSMGMIGRAKYEYEVQAEVEYTFRRRNADYWGYPSIVGCGPNATTLHYVTSQGEVKKGDLMLMDVGAEYDHYTADVTRTFPVNGKFSKEQAEIYQIVYDAQEAAAKELKPGSTFRAASSAANKVVRNGLTKLGLMTDPNGVIDVKNGDRIITRPQSIVWYLHGLGHWLGMNVHDVGNYGVTLKEGMIMTNEPGLYFREDALDYLPDTEKNREFISKVKPVYEKYKNIGVRIEDDMVITKDGVDWMNKDLPRTIKGVEAFMAKAKKEMDRYAIKSKPNYTNFVIHNLGVNALSFDNQYGMLNEFGALSGKTIRSGWISESKTHEIHSH